jgi:tRNA threonylcarbamoyladenosine biosynthesis protein TsaE
VQKITPFQHKTFSLEAMQTWAKDFAQALTEQLAHQKKPLLICLQGDLGAGKTTFARALIQAKHPALRVKSPTYTLVESYPFGETQVHHFDLYRLCSPEELEDMGVRDYFDAPNLLLVEWYEKAQGLLPPPDWTLRFEYQGMDARALSLIEGQACD